MDEPLAIKPLKRFIADQEIKNCREPSLAPAPLTGAKVAIVGAGPAGLSCAFYLGRLGHPSTIFEADAEPGGMAAVGIPDYRLPRDILRREASMVEAIGSEIRYGVRVGTDIKIQELLEQGYAAVFLGVGAPESSSMRCRGEDSGYIGFLPGISFLREAAAGRRPLEGKKVAVIGGGNVAMDCARTAVRMGFEEVNIVYRRTRAEMPADHVEIEEAMEEGVHFHFLEAPTAIHASDGKVTGLGCQRMALGEPDASGRRRPVPVEGDRYIMELDAVIPAIGQICAVDVVFPEARTTRWNTLMVDDLIGQSESPNIFGGGDCVTGPSTLIAALAAGKRAANYITRYLAQGICPPSEEDLMDLMFQSLGVFESEEKMPCKGFTKRMTVKALPPEVRIKSFEEVEATPSSASARKEASRCLRCYRIGLAAMDGDQRGEVENA